MTAKKKPDPEPEEVTAEPTPELAEAVDEFIPSSRDLAVVDPSDQHEVMLRMDEHDVRMLLEQIQRNTLRVWVYEFRQDGHPVRGLTVHAVQDIVQRMNWTGKCKIGLLTDAEGRPVLDVERVVEDDKPYWMVTAYAKDDLTGSVLPGASYEPVYMRLRNGSEKFDPFSRWKAIQKATRNAMGAFIPEEVEQAVIGMFSKDPSRVERIQTEAEAKVAELPPALTDEKAKAQIAEARGLYEEIRELGGGQGKVRYTPGHFNGQLTAVQHDHGRLNDFIEYLKQRKAEIAAEFEETSA